MRENTNINYADEIVRAVSQLRHWEAPRSMIILVPNIIKENEGDFNEEFKSIILFFLNDKHYGKST
jgi:hypothetical protein